MLFTSIEEIKKYISVSVASKWDTIKPILEVVSREFMRPVMGAAMYDELQEFYTTDPAPAPGETTDAMNELLALAQSAEIHLAYWYGYDVLNVFISASGFKRTETEKEKGLYRYTEENLKLYFKNAGFNGLDSVLEYLEGDNKAIFTEYQASETAKALKLMFIPSTEIFNKIYFIGKSRLIFNRLGPFDKIVEETIIKPVLGEVNYDFIKSELAKDAPADKIALIMPYLRNAIPYFATAMLMQETGADLSDKGLVWEGTRSANSSHTESGPAELERVKMLIARNNALGESYLNSLRSFLLKNAADWDGYAGPPSRAFNRDNNGKKIFVA